MTAIADKPARKKGRTLHIDVAARQTLQFSCDIALVPQGNNFGIRMQRERKSISQIPVRKMSFGNLLEQNDQLLHRMSYLRARFSKVAEMQRTMSSMSHTFLQFSLRQRKVFSLQSLRKYISRGSYAMRTGQKLRLRKLFCGLLGTS